MSDLLTSSISSLAKLKQQRELQRQPFPLWALLALYEKGSRQTLYCNYFEGFKLLVAWLNPIEIPQLTIEQRQEQQNRIPKMFHTYDIQEIATILNTSQESIYHGYQTTLSKLFIAANTSLMPAQIPTEKTGS